MKLGTQLGQYEILSSIGKGGMGEVWKAKDRKLGREVAIKTLPGEFANDPDRLSRFEREAKLLASLNHSNIAAIYGLEESNGTRFLVLELIEGDTLADRIRRCPLPVEESLKLALQIAEALEAAHEKGVVHRDLKPANIKVTPDGKVKLLDFGLAKALAADAADMNLSNSPTLSMAATQAGILLGTAAYMSPEQARGETTDERVDIWAFGCVLFEMLTGRGTFEGKTVSDILAAVLKTEPDWKSLPANIHPRVRLLLERCLEKESKNRYHDIADARVDIQKVLSEPGGVSAPPIAALVQSNRRSQLPWVAAIVLTAIAIGLSVWSLRPAPEPRTIARFSYVLPEGQSFTRVGRPVVALSPDGSKIVYVANGQLYVRRIDGLESSPIPGTTEDPLAPLFSPDGQWVGYWSGKDSKLKKIAISGGAPVALCDAEFPFDAASWGEDDTIVWSQAEGIMRVSANGGTPELLVARGKDGGASLAGGSLNAPQILPDGKSALFHVGNATSGEIAVQSLKTGERKVLFPGVNPSYVSTGHLIYGVDNVLFAVPFDLRSLQVTGGPVPMIEGVRPSPTQYAVSDSGSLIYVPGGTAATTSDRILALVGRDGVVKPLNVPHKEYLSPRFSPDGRKLAVQTVQGGKNVIWVYDLSGKTAIQQLTFEGDNQWPIWTPDGKRITFSSDRDGTKSLYTMLADGSGVPERLTTAEKGTLHLPGSWSPDGQTLVFHVLRGLVLETNAVWHIWTLSHDSGRTQKLYDSPGYSYNGAELSSDGKWLAYGARPSPGTVDIYVEPFPPTGSRRRISQNGGYWPMWSADGSKLFYRPVASTGARTLQSVDVVTAPEFGFSNEQTLPIKDYIAVAYHRDYDIAPDGQHFLMVFPAGQVDSGQPVREQINVVLNWSTELQRRVPVK